MGIAPLADHTGSADGSGQSPAPRRVERVGWKRVGHMKMVNHQLHNRRGVVEYDQVFGLVSQVRTYQTRIKSSSPRNGWRVRKLLYLGSSGVLEECRGRIPSSLPVTECGASLPSHDGLTGEEVGAVDLTRHLVMKRLHQETTRKSLGKQEYLIHRGKFFWNWW